MMRHTFVCDSCNIDRWDTDTKKVHICERCGEEMRWDLRGNASGQGDYHHTSDSLAFHPDDIPEHRKLFPGVEVTPEGQPQFTSVKQQERYAERSAGCYKKRQRIKYKGKRIA